MSVACISSSSTSLRIEEAMDMLAIDLDSDLSSFDKEDRMLIPEGLHENREASSPSIGALGVLIA